jgi:hypothetical protein
MLFDTLPEDVQALIKELLLSDNFPAAKALYDKYKPAS